MAMLQPMEIETVRKEFLLLPEELRQGIPENNPIAMQQAVEASKAKAALNVNPNDPASQWKNQLTDTLDGIKNLERGNTMASSVKFNLKKHAQGMGFNEATPNDMFGAETSPAGLAAEQNEIAANPLEDQQTEDPQTKTQFNDAADLRDTLDSFDSGQGDQGQPVAINAIQQKNPTLYTALKGNENISGLVSRYWSIVGPEDRLRAAEGIYKFLPREMQSNQPDNTTDNGMNVPANPTTFSQTDLSSYLNTITASIKEVADKVGKNKIKKQAKTFNLKKTAQHLNGRGAIMWGPSQVRPDPFLRGQPVSDWHILERNKGFGQDIDGVWNIDWEAVWRGNVMDKYSRPYRDTTTGEWVGGYIQKRFEVDKNIPETNNYQLLPGERRKPYLPEYGSTEARLQAMRNKDDGNLGRVFNDTTKPFNWREASAKALIKTADKPRSNYPLWMEDQDTEADQVVEDAMGQPMDNQMGVINDANQEFSNMNTPSENGVPPESDLDPTLYALLNPHAHHSGRSNLEMGDIYDTQGLNPDQIANDDASMRMKARQMTRDMAGLGVAADAKVDLEAQTDVTTEKQLANVAGRPGILGLPSIQRHDQDQPELEANSEYKNNYGDGIKDKSAGSSRKLIISEAVRAQLKKKTETKGNRTVSSVKTAWLSEGRPPENPLNKPLLLPGEKAPNVSYDTEKFCPRCGAQVASNGGNSKDMSAGGGTIVNQPNKCPNCHFQISDKTTDSGIAQQHAPDAPKPKTNTPGTNVVLNEVLFDSNTKRFIIAKSEHPDTGFMEMREDRKKFFPHKKDLPRTNDNIPSREFKQMLNPAVVDSMDNNPKVDNVTKSCMDLAIDG